MSTLLHITLNILQLGGIDAQKGGCWSHTVIGMLSDRYALYVLPLEISNYVA